MCDFRKSHVRLSKLAPVKFRRTQLLVLTLIFDQPVKFRRNNTTTIHRRRHRNHYNYTMNFAASFDFRLFVLVDLLTQVLQIMCCVPSCWSRFKSTHVVCSVSDISGEDGNHPSHQLPLVFYYELSCCSLYSALVLDV